MSSRLARVVGWPPAPSWIAFAGAVLLGVELGARVFTSNDEARFPLLAQDILTRGDWLWPQLNGVGYFNKPPLLAWLIALVSWPAGHVTQLTAVLPSAAAVVATVLLVHALARDLFDAEAGRIAALVAMTTQGLFFHAHLALPDALMTCFITASVWMLVRMTLEPSGRWWIGFYGFAAAAFWAKGPAGLMPLAVGLAYRLTTRSGRPWSLRLGSGLPLLGGLVALWWVLGAFSDSHAVRDAVVTDQLGWYRPRGGILVLLTGPVRNLAVALSPWVLLAPVAVPAAVLAYRRDRTRPALLLPLVWLTVTIALVALSHEQRLRYYAPVAPPMALVMGWWLGSRRVERGKDGGTRAPWSELVAGRVRAALPFVWLATVAAFGIGYHLEVTHHNAGSYDRLAERVRAFDGASAVVVWGIPELPLAFYLDRTVTRVHTEPQLHAALDRTPSAVVVATESNWARRRPVETSVPRAAEAIDPAQVVLVHRSARR